MLNKNAFLRFITADIEYRDDIALLRKLVIINALILAIILLFTVFALFNQIRGESLVASLDWAGLLVCGYAYFQLYARKRLDFAIHTVSVALMVFLLALAFFGQNRDYSLIWTFFLPIFVFMLNGRKTGGWMVFVFYGVLIPMAFIYIGEWQNGNWTFSSFMRFSIASLVMVYTCYYSELAMEKSYTSYKQAQLEEQRLLAERNALMMETLEKQDKLLTDVSHEIRTPLSIMRMNVEALQDGIVNRPEEAYKKLQDKITELDRLIQDLTRASNFSRQYHDTNCQIMDVKWLLSQVVQKYQPSFAQANLELTLSTNDDLFFACIDSHSMTIVFDKLLDNSLRYTDSPGQVIVSVNKDDKNVILTLDDSAPAVPKRDHDKLCDRLFRVESSRNRQTGGAGLGLSVAKVIVEAHKGKISIDDSSLGGLKVRVKLPLA
ncbi:sensor histidine kinase [Kangiella sp.]|uniref:sensor histidine kinase n=1 Tax=Kangiella sp. TaxID=1920245 RepID=UPI003A9158A1